MGKIFDSLTEDWKDLHKIVIFGFGKMGRGNIDALMSRFQIVKIIDNNPELEGQSYKGINIVTLLTYESLHMKEKIVVVTSGNRYNSISAELKESGYQEYDDFCDFATFCNDFFWNDRKELFIGRLTFNITTYCTLNCKHCTMLTPYNKNKKHFDIEQIKKDVKSTFSIVDYVSNFLILGGEPFLHKDLKELIIFIGIYYRNKIGNLQIITNGTLKVPYDLIEVLKQYNVEVRISDYTGRVDYDEQLRVFCADLDLHGVEYLSYSHDEWLDMGFPNGKVNMGDDAEELRRHMLKCNPNCQNVSEGKLYYCAQGWAAEQSGLFSLQPTDYLELEDNSGKSGKEKFRKFYFGDLDNDYFSFCKVCRGWDTDIVVPGGIQFESGID